MIPCVSYHRGRVMQAVPGVLCLLFSFHIRSGYRKGPLCRARLTGSFPIERKLGALRDRKHAHAPPRFVYHQWYIVYINSSPLYRRCIPGVWLSCLRQRAEERGVAGSNPRSVLQNFFMFYFSLCFFIYIHTYTYPGHDGDGDGDGTNQPRMST